MSKAAVLDGLLKGLARHLARQVTRMLREAGDPKPRQLAKHLVASLLANDNPLRVIQEKPHIALASSTFSERLQRLDLRRFLEGFNRALLWNALELLSRLKADGHEILAIIDEHQEVYWFDRKRHKKPCTAPRCRCQCKFAIHSDNKAGYWANDFVVSALTWKHQGKRLTIPVRMDPVMGVQSTDPASQLRTLWSILRRHRIRVDAVLLDRGYDSKNVHNLAAKWKIPLVYRVTWTGRNGRFAFVGDERKRCDIRDLVKLGVQSGVLYAYRDRRSGRLLGEQRRVHNVVFPGRVGEVDLVIAAGVHRRREGPPGWELVKDEILVLAAPPGWGARRSLRAYRKRWEVETLFQQWATDKPKPHSKTINSFVILFSAYVYRMVLGQIVVFVAYLPTRIETKDKRLISISRQLVVLGVAAIEAPD